MFLLLFMAVTDSFRGGNCQFLRRKLVVSTYYCYGEKCQYLRNTSRKVLDSSIMSSLSSLMTFKYSSKAEKP